MRSLAEILHEHPHVIQSGLTEAEASESRRKYGSNRLTPLPREPIWRKFLEKFDEPIINILLGASLLKIIVDLFGISLLAGFGSLIGVALLIGVMMLISLRQWIPTALFITATVLFTISAVMGHPSIEGLAVMVAIIIATGVSFLSEYRSDREFEKLNSHKGSINVKVVRAGVVRSIPMEEIVVADRLILEMGDEIPADGRVIASNEWMIDQSLMTGESEPIRKVISANEAELHGPDNPGCVYRGTQVIDGLGEMIVCSVGDQTMLGQIARNLTGGTPDEESQLRVQSKLTMARDQTPLQIKLTTLAGQISRIGYLAAILIFLALLARGMITQEITWPATQQEFIDVTNHLLEYFVYMVIVVVVAVPEGLPMSVTVSLALAMRKMTRSNALVRQLMATETIGSATIICSDKTGTLTQNKMTVVRVCIADTFTELNNRTATWQLIANSAINSTATLEEKQGKIQTSGNTTEGALLFWLRDCGLEYTQIRIQSPTIHRFTFSSDTKRMTTLAKHESVPRVFVKGAPEAILAQCRSYRDTEGAIHPLDESARQRIQAMMDSAAADAMRTLAFADREIDPSWLTDTEELIERRHDLESDLIFAGFVAIRDPIRPEVPDAISQCHQAGIAVTMITGDNPETARAIAREIGLLQSPASIVLTSDEFNRLTDAEVKSRLPELRVLARAKPLDKYRMVKLLQEQGHVVAMTGDGTNDAPSLKKADVGLAMGLTGTEVAKEASQIVLLDDSFGTIVKAVHWGRSLYENIQRFLVFQLTINASALIIAFLGPFLGVKPPFTVLQLLWINVIMDTFAAMALCSEQPRPGLMTMPPKRRNESIVTRKMLITIGTLASFFVLIMLVLLFNMANGNQWFRGESPGSEAFSELSVRQVTIFFTVYVFFQVWNLLNCRSLTSEVPGWKGLWTNPVFLGITLVSAVGQILIVTFGGVVFAVEPLTWREWLTITLGTSSVLIFAELTRWWRKLWHSYAKRTPTTET